jgi:hypothetical protein
MANNRGIYLVANFKSQTLCENLIYSIRQSGCTLPIKLIHYGGKRINSLYIQSQVQLVDALDFPVEGTHFLDRLQSILTDCPRGYLHRFLAWFGEWDEFIYSDNDIVALMNWENLFDFLPGHQLVHADEEYLTEGRFNHNKPQFIQELFGPDALTKAFTAGHYLSVKDSQIVADIDLAIEWFKAYPEVPKLHDQSLLHIASLLGKWRTLNLCKDPNNWLTTWASDYRNNLTIIQAIQAEQKISHLHYSGRKPDGTQPVDDLLFSNLPQTQRLNRLMVSGLQNIIHLDYLRFQRKRVKRVITKLFR